MNDKEFWKMRAEEYNELNWVKETTYIETLIEAGDFKKTDSVLDVGTGTGVIANAVSPLVKEVIGIDMSQDMLEHSAWTNNKYFIKKNVLEPFFNTETFDKITARMVFHHIIDDTQKAMDECFRVLKKGGKMIIAEGTPAIPELKKDYQEIFALKEDRLTFLESDIIALMKNSGFKNITTIIHTMKNFSVLNWLRKSHIPRENQDKIFDLHINGSQQFKEAYNLKIVDGDCLIDTKSIIAVGEK